MITYKSYEDIQPMVVTMDKIQEFEVWDSVSGTLAWVYIDGEPAFQVKNNGTDYQFTLDHFDEPEGYKKLLSAMNEPSHFHEIIWDLIYQENDVDRKLMVFNQGNILIKENKNIGQ